MNKSEAKAILNSELNLFRNMPYRDLVETIDGDVFTKRCEGSSGKHYQVEIETFWENSWKKKIHIVGSIDEFPHKPLFWKIPVLRWIPIYISSVTQAFTRKENKNGSDIKLKQRLCK